MQFTIHHGVLGLAFLMALVMGAVTGRTHFCTMGGVSDWLVMGSTERMRAWLLAAAVATLGVLGLEASGAIVLPLDSFPPYRTENFAWPRYVLGGLMFGAGMTLAGGCANRVLVRIGGGNLKSVVVVVVAGLAAYAMMWTDFFGLFFLSWIEPVSLHLARSGIPSQELGALVSAGKGGAVAHYAIGAALSLGALGFALASPDFRRNRGLLASGLVVGLAVMGGWWVTGGTLGKAWKEYADFASTVPSRVAVQSFTFVSPLGDAARYLMSPGNLSLLNFGILAMLGVMTGSFLQGLAGRSLRLEWFASWGDFGAHILGALLMGVGGVLSMGCTIGQAVTGVSTLALGSFLTFASIVLGAAGAIQARMKLLD